MARVLTLRNALLAALLCACLYAIVSFRAALTRQELVGRKERHFGCKWSEGDPIVIQLKTKMGVTYDGGHWFHMAENFMATFSALRANHRTLNATVIYFVFDEEYVSQLNAMTKFMVTVAVTDGSVKEVHFLYHPDKEGSGHDHLEGIAVGSTVVMHKLRKNKTTATHHVVHLDRSVPTAERFVKSAESHHHDKDGRSHCAQYFGSLGGVWPTPQRGHWFPNPGDVQEFRDRTAKLCPRDDGLVQLHSKPADKPYKLVMYQRDLSRRILEGDKVLSDLRGLLGPRWAIEVVMHKFDRSPCELAHILVDVDVLITPHGFQSMVLLFMPRPSLLFEVFPYRYQKSAYAPLCREYGLYYGASMSPAVSPLWKMLLGPVSTEQCMNNRYCRNFARDDDVRVTAHSLNRLRESIVDYLHRREEGGCRSTASAAVVAAGGTAPAGSVEVGVGLGGDSVGRFVTGLSAEDTLVRPVVCESLYLFKR